MEKVSIIIPMYNVENYIEKCINSIKNQTYSNIEVLLIDDCSTDSTSEKAKKLIEKDDRFKYIKREKNGGLSAARNTGLEYVTGEYISFVDSDDWISENFILHLYEKAKKEDADIVVCDYAMVNDEGQESPANTLENLNDTSSIEEKVAYIRNHVVTKLFRTEFFKKQELKFPEIKRAAEMGLSIPMLTRTSKIAILKETLYYYYQRSNSLSNNRKREKIDLSFYDKAFNNVIKNSNGLYPKEIEYHAIIEKVYGKTMLMIRHLYSTKEIKQHLNEFDQQFPKWRKNPYIKNMNLLKKIFVKMASIKFIFILKVMVEINERRK